MLRSYLLVVLLTLFLSACGGHNWNSPYPAVDSGKNILYVHCKSAWSKASFRFDILRSGEADDDRLNFFSSYAGTMIGLAAFLLLIAFQSKSSSTVPCQNIVNFQTFLFYFVFNIEAELWSTKHKI